MGFLDQFTNIDELLERLIARIGGVTEDETFFFSYPSDGTRAELGIGTTTIDFVGGTVIDYAGRVTNLGNSLRARGREYCRSLSVQADRDIIIQIGTKSRIPIAAGTWFKVAHLRYTDLKIFTTVVTNVFVFGSTNPDAIEMAGESYTKDPVDVWGNTTTIGNAELAVRTHAPPLTYDRRGSVRRWIDFESPTERWRGTELWCGACGRSLDTALSGDFSMKTELINASSLRTISIQMTDLHPGRVGLQAVSCSENKHVEESIDILHYDGTTLHQYYMFHNKESGKIQIVRDGPHYVTVDTVDFWTGISIWSTMKLVINIETHKYVRALIFGKEYDISEYSCLSAADATIPNIQYKIKCEGTASGSCDYYIDNMVVTEEEPI